MRLVIIESPFAGDVEKNIRYARACVRDSLLRGESPIASHLLYTQEGILNDDVPAERQHGIDAGLAWRRRALFIPTWVSAKVWNMVSKLHRMPGYR